jgi:hypothetical protein
MATLAANDQENAVRHLHAGAAGKSLNAGLKSFNAKTPGNKAPKTPFKVPLNDENAIARAGKSVFQTKGQGNELFTTKKGGKIDENAFVTPAGRTRDDRLRNITTDMSRSANSRAAGHEDDQRQVQALWNPSAALLCKNAETQPSPAPSESQGSPTRNRASVGR